MSHAQAELSVGANTASVVTELLVSGMTCNNCARHVTEALQSVPGVRSALVMLEAQRASVRWTASAKADVPAVLAAVKKAGYEAKPVEAGAHDHGEHSQAGWHLNLWLGVLGTVPLMAGEWIFGLGMERWFQWLSFVLAGLVQVFAGAQFYRGAWRQLKISSSNMDTLVALGSTTAFGYSTWALLSGHGGHVYFMEAAAIITLVSVGHWIEARVSARASSALRSLMQLTPPTARRLVAEASPRDFLNLRQPSSATAEEQVPVSELKVGDLVELRPGDHVPTDGVVTKGESAVDEAMLTGESVPVDKGTRSELYAGTVNLNGRLVMRVTATGESTALAHIIAAVERAQTSRADIQRLGDRVSSIFVPIVVVIAIAAGLWWGFAPDAAKQVHHWLAQFLWPAHPPEGALSAAFIIAAAVLIIACPCAMGLATPAAIMASANAAARRGILIRDGVALEKAGSVTAIIFDKTGTLTVGKPEVVKICAPLTPSLPMNRRPTTPLPSLSSPSEGEERVAAGRERSGQVQGFNARILWGNLSPSDGERVVEDRVRGIAAALARHSTHPISQAIAKSATGEMQLTGWQEVRGAGIAATVEIRNPKSEIQNPVARLGSLRWLRESGVDLALGEDFIHDWSAQGATIVGLALDQTLHGLFAVRDTVKPGAAGVIGQLHRHGLKTFLVTGDNALTAATIAKQTGIAAENVFAEVRPEQKADFVKKLQQRGERVAFVGDGINDAPALEQADLGIAVSRASDIAREAADIILLKSDIEAVPEALGLARATLRTINQNLFWAFFYNAIGVPLAALGFMSPVLCAAAMGVSDLVVIGNALRLRRWRG